MGTLSKCPNNAVKDLELTAAMKKQHLHTAIFLADHRDEERFGGRFREQIRTNKELAAFLEEANRRIEK